MVSAAPKSSPNLLGEVADAKRLTEGCRRASGGCAANPTTIYRMVPLPETSSGRIE
jgi:hypothetical protein